MKISNDSDDARFVTITLNGIAIGTLIAISARETVEIGLSVDSPRGLSIDTTTLMLDWVEV